MKKQILQENNAKQYLVTTKEGKKYLAYLQDDEKSRLTSRGASVEDPATGQNGVSGIVSEDQFSGDYLTLGKDLGKALALALREHGDEIEGLFLKASDKDGCVLRVRYKPAEDGAKWEDQFDIKYIGKPGEAKAVLVDGEDRYDLCDISQQSGSAQINKDVAKAAFSTFLRHKTDIGKSDIKASDPDITGGQQIDEQPTSENSQDVLWETEEGLEAFLEAVQNYHKGKNKGTVKNLFKAARNFKKGDTIQEKLAGAVAWYKDPANKVSAGRKSYKNTEKQVFSGDGFADMGGAIEEEQKSPIFDSEGFEIYRDFLIPVTVALEKFEDHINRTEDTWVGSYYSSIYRDVEKLANFVQKYDKPDPLDESESSINEAKVIENYHELFKKFSQNFSDQDLVEAWEKIYPECYRKLKDTILYPYANIIQHILVAKGIISAVDGSVIKRPWEDEEDDEYRGADMDESKSPLKEGINNDPQYTHYIVNRATNKIVFGYDYSDTERADMAYYTKLDMEDNDWSPKDYKLIGKKALERQGINPDDDSNWANN